MHLISRFRTTSALTVLAGLACVTSAHAQAVVDQPFTTLGSYTSQNDTRPGGLGNYDTAYDDFTVAAGANIGTVTWVGEYFNGNPAPISGFTVNFYADNAGVPGTLLQTNPIVGDANESPIGLDTFGNSMFSYSTTLPAAFGASAGTPYWMSVVPDLPMDASFDPQWGWAIGSGGNGASYQTFSNGGGSGGFGNFDDLAFSLTPAATPEPGSFALLAGAGLTGAACLRRRRAKKAPQVA